MKKLLIIIVAVFISSPLFALPEFLPEFRLSAGGGGIFNSHWYNAVLNSQFRDYMGQDMRPPHGVMGPTEQTQSAMRQGLFDTRDLTLGGGIFGFFDATFATLGVGVVWNNVRQIVDIPDLSETINPALAGEETHHFRFTQLNISLMLRYPFQIAERLQIFPMLGVDWQIGLGDFDDRLREDFQGIANLGYEMPTLGQFWNSLWIRAGVGADFTLHNNLFLRTELLYGLKLPSSYESRMADYWEPNLRGMSNGVHLRVAIGFTFR